MIKINCFHAMLLSYGVVILYNTVINITNYIREVKNFLKKEPQRTKKGQGDAENRILKR